MTHTEKSLPTPKETREFGGQIFTLESYPNFISLSEEKRLAVATELIPLTAQGFMRFQIDDEIKNDVLNHVARAPRLRILRDNNNEALMFIASAVIDLPEPVYYLGGIIVSPSLQGFRDKIGISIAQSLLQEDISSTNAQLIALQTQSERMRSLASKLADLDPKLAISLAPLIRPGLNLDGDINRRTYRGGYCLYDDIDRFSQIAIKDLGFNWLEGDAKFLVGYLKQAK